MTFFVASSPGAGYPGDLAVDGPESKITFWIWHAGVDDMPAHPT